MIGVFSQKFTKLIPLRFVDLGAVAIGRHLVRFVHDTQVEVHVTQQIQDIVLAGDEINRGNALRRVFPDVSAIGRIDSGSVDDAERLSELVVQFPPPLVSQVRWRDDERALNQAPEFEFLDQQPSHDGFARTGIICNQEANAGLGE